MKILFTGAAGFLGSHLSEKYVREGHTIFCLLLFFFLDKDDLLYIGI
jgi:UDP-glucuronate decarboxylase